MSLMNLTILGYVYIYIYIHYFSVLADYVSLAYNYNRIVVYM